MTAAPISAADREKDDPVSISPSDPRVVLAGIRHFGLAHDRADLQDLEYAFERLSARVVELEAALASEKKRADELNTALEQEETDCEEMAAQLDATEARATALLEALTKIATGIQAIDLRDANEMQEVARAAINAGASNDCK